jgi:hypothetical protein
MRRREFIALLGGAATAWPLTARAQQPERMRRIGVLLPATADDPVFQDRVGAFLQVCVPKTCRFRKLHPIDSRSAANQNMIVA